MIFSRLWAPLPSIRVVVVVVFVVEHNIPASVVRYTPTLLLKGSSHPVLPGGESEEKMLSVTREG